MSGDHNQYQKDKSYLDFECPRCGHCCYVDDDDTSQERVDETAKCKHEWVGLADKEKSDLWCESTGRDWVNEDTHVFADAIEAKLREKNT
jgi:hypothetical protein